jgi:hypothetical protein
MPFLFYRFIITQLLKISQGEIIPISVSTRRKEQPHHLKSSCSPAARRAGKLPDPSYNTTVQDFARRNHSHLRFNEAKTTTASFRIIIKSCNVIFSNTANKR